MRASLTPHACLRLKHLISKRPIASPSPSTANRVDCRTILKTYSDLENLRLLREITSENGGVRTVLYDPAQHTEEILRMVLRCRLRRWHSTVRIWAVTTRLSQPGFPPVAIPASSCRLQHGRGSARGIWWQLPQGK